MGPSEAVGSVFANYANFAGRARRSEYWWFWLANIAAVIVFSGIMAISHGLGIVLIVVWSLAVIVPGIAVTIRRLHDTGRSGLWWFIAFVPFVGSIILLFILVIDSQPGANQWGISQKYPAGPVYSGVGGMAQPPQGYGQPPYYPPGGGQPGSGWPAYPQPPAAPYQQSQQPGGYPPPPPSAYPQEPGQ